MKRLLILGSTGSIGTQALDVVARAGDELELVGLSRRRSLGAARRAGARARRPADRAGRPGRRRARRRGVDRRRGAQRRRGARAARRSSPAPTSCSTRSSAPPASGPTVAALGEGIDLALANKESLVVGGELVTALAEATGAQLLPVDSEHSALHQLLAGEPPGRASSASSSPPPAGRSAAARDELAGVTRRGGAQAPDVVDGRQDHDRLGDADEQGPRGDRGPPPVRHALRAHRRRRAPAVDRPRAGRSCATAPRSRTSAIPTCACRSPTRCTTPTAPTCPIQALDLAAVGALTFEAPDPDAFPCLRLAREAARRRRHRAVRAQRRQRGRRARLPRRPASASPASPR